MNRLRSMLAGGANRVRPILSKVETPLKQQVVQHGHDGPPQPFDNMPFSIPNRYVATFCFSVFFGSGLTVPFLILWYSMAKRTL